MFWVVRATFLGRVLSISGHAEGQPGTNHGKPELFQHTTQDVSACQNKFDAPVFSTPSRSLTPKSKNKHHSYASSNDVDESFVIPKPMEFFEWQITTSGTDKQAGGRTKCPHASPFTNCAS